MFLVFCLEYIVYLQGCGCLLETYSTTPETELLYFLFSRPRPIIFLGLKVGNPTPLSRVDGKSQRSRDKVRDAHILLAKSKGLLIKQEKGSVVPGGKETSKVISVGLLSWNQGAEWSHDLAKWTLRAPGK